MEREIALKRLKELEGRNLHELARLHQVTVMTSTGSINKGWAGHVCERHPINSSQSPNFGSRELKSIPLNSQPTLDEMVVIMAKHKSHVEVVPVDYKYSIGNQGSKVGDNKNDVQEYIFVGY